MGAKSLGAYGGYETFVYKLTEYHQNKENIKYHVACKANGDGCMDESKFEGVTKMQRIINYGSFLQAYGLKKMIESVSKSEVEFIDYRFGVDITNRLKKPQSKAESIVDKILKNRTPWNYLKKKNFFKEIERNLILDLKDED